mmetsp:Transcript_27423/g.63460  ORF Transcript_27423/g.63460 Transcript_27423/m.63460 type:complete len:604 (+) Transcript_27423:436-2247(+)
MSTASSSPSDDAALLLHRALDTPAVVVVQSDQNDKKHDPNDKDKDDHKKKKKKDPNYNPWLPEWETPVHTEPLRNGATTPCPVDHCLQLGPTAAEQYPNRIVFLYKEGGAGLMDRLVRLRHLMNLGALLCATVEIPPPKALLCRRHNAKANVPKSLTWNDLASFEFLRQEQQQEHDSNDNATTTTTTTAQKPQYHTRQLWSPMVLQDGNNKSATLQEFYQRQATPDSRRQVTHFYYNNDNGTHYLQDMYDLVQRRIWQAQDDDNPRQQTQESFLWIIKPRSFWNFLRLDLQGQLQQMMEREQQQQQQPRSVTNVTAASQTTVKSARVPQFTQANLTKRACGQYVRYRYPPLLLALAKLCLRQALAGNDGGQNRTVLGLNYSEPLLVPPFGFFHIRRGDATSDCDTEFARMKSVVNCSLSGPQTKAYLKAQVDDRSWNDTTYVRPWMIPRDNYPQPFLVFFATDDPHKTYRRSIRQLLERQPLLGKKKRRPWIRAVDLDKLIVQVVQRQVDLGDGNEVGVDGAIPPKYATNNYVIFAIGKILSTLSLFTLSQRKARYCEDCSQDLVETAFAEYVRQQDAEQHLDREVRWQRQEDLWNSLDFVDQ